MKNFTFTDLSGKSHIYRPSDFSASSYTDGIFISFPCSQVVRADLEEYARKSHHYINHRRLVAEKRKKIYCDLYAVLHGIYRRNFNDFSFLYVMRVYSVVVHSEIYRSHYALRRGYCLKQHRNFATADFYFGRFGGGWCAYDFLTTQYQKIGIFTFTDYWFLNGEVDFAKVEAFRSWCGIVSDNFLDNVDSILKI